MITIILNVSIGGRTFTSKTKRSYLLLYWQKNITVKIFNEKRIQKEKYEKKGETKNNK